MSLSVILNSALSGLRTAQGGMQVVSQNIANVNTEGYTRKQASQASVVLNGVGAGVNLAQITREVSDELIRDLRSNSSTLAERQVLEQYLGRIEQMFGPPSADTSIGAAISELRSALEALAAAPEDLTLRENVLRTGERVANQLNDLSRTIQQMRLDAERDIDATVDGINTRLEQIAELNAQISRAQLAGQPTGDLEDLRDQAVLQVAEQMNVRSYTRANGELVLTTGTGRMLVDGANVMQIGYTAQVNITATTTFNAITVGGVDITAEISGGRLAGLIDMRDDTLPDLTAELNELTEHLATNAASPPPPAAPTLQLFTGVNGALTDNAGTIVVNPALIANPNLLNNIPAARDLADGLNNSTISFAAAGDLPTLSTSLAGYGNAILSNLASTRAVAVADLTYSQNFQTALNDKIGQVSGVNMDEELAQMIELQKAYSAAGRMIQVVSEMLDFLNEIV